MKVSVFTFLRNGAKLGYPFIESILSALPIADEFVIALGPSDPDEGDRTRIELEALAEPKIRIVPLVWNEQMKRAGFVYGPQKMLAQSQCNGDWAFYLEADEVLHDQDLDALYGSMQRHLANPKVEALVFDYIHLFGSVDWQAVSPGWYRRAPRIIRNNIRAVALDGLFWNVVVNNQRLRWPRAALANARMFHYGHVRTVTAMNAKQFAVERYWNKDPNAFSKYAIDPRALRAFDGQHPAVMKDWIQAQSNLNFVPDDSHRPNPRERRHRVAMKLEQLFGLDLSRKHFRLIGDGA